MNIFEQYELLCSDVKHQVGFIDDYYEFDAKHLKETLDDIIDLQEKIRNEFNSL